MQCDVLRLDQAAWDAVQDFPEHKMSALDSRIGQETVKEVHYGCRNLN
jgi:hypothetical protein